MSNQPRIAVDAMGGDDAPRAVVEGAIAAVRAGLDVTLVGDEPTIREIGGRRCPPVVHADEVADMDGSPASIRKRPGVSIRRAMQLVRDGRADAVVSCGNTGATLFAAVLDLGTLDGAERPAIATMLPRKDGGRLVLLDAGANVDCRPELLACFAKLGVAYAEAHGVEAPRVGLLSNGEEDQKGNIQVRATLPLLRSSNLNVVGNIEPNSAMLGQCDVLVCDGFVGNVLLKAAEGAVETVVGLLREEVMRYPSGRLGAFLLKGAFERFRRRVAWDARGGALLLGTRGVVVVGHGRANPGAVQAAIETAGTYVENGLLDRLAHRLAD